MPANLTPQYKEAERSYRQATTPEEQERALAEMLSLIPKHKGTEKLQADIKRRLSKLRKEKGKKGGAARQRPGWVIDIEGAGQVPVLGAPNSGKSALIAALSGAPVQVADYPYTTQQPAPAMMPFEDAQVQLIDTPPASSEYAPPWLSELVRRADAVIMVADLSDPDGWVGPAFIVEALDEHGIELVAARVEGTAGDGSNDRGAGGNGADSGAAEQVERGLTFRLPAILVATKADAPEADACLAQLHELFDTLPILPVSTSDADALERLRRATFMALRVIRVYSKEPGKTAERQRPWLLQEGSTVLDLANLIHHDLARGFRYGRLWGSARFEGQRVGEDYVLSDEDIVEIHTA